MTGLLYTLWSVASAASWSVGTPLPPDGGVEVPAGVAVRLVVMPAGAPVAVLDPHGGVVDARGLSDGTLIPAAGTTRSLRVVAEPGAKVWVHTASGADGAREWEVWARDLDRWLDGPADAVLPAPPWGGERLRASIVLRRRALGDTPTTRLGALRDLMLERPIEGGGYRSRHEVGSIANRPVHVRGPGLVLIAVKPAATGRLVREHVGVQLDGLEQAPLPVASTGSAPISARRWIPPGFHRLEAFPSDAGTEVRATVLSLRPALFAPTAGMGAVPPPNPRAPRSALDIAEAAWLAGDFPTAARLLPDLLDTPGAVGELARARWMDVAPASELLALTEPHDASPEALELLADAALRRADGLPPEVVLSLVLRARDPDLASLARWMDGLGGSRAAGLALLYDAAPSVPWGPSPAMRAVREAALATRWTTLAPDPAATPGPTRLDAAGPGIPRVRVAAGTQVAIALPDPGEGLFPVLRLRADTWARYRVDGELRAGEGPLDEALVAGAHTLTVEEGTVLVLDPEVAPQGERVYEHVPTVLPARWTVPDPGVEAWIRVTGQGARTVAFDDGHLEPVTIGPDGVSEPIRVPPHGTAFTLDGEPGSVVSVALRTPRMPEPLPPAPLALGDDPFADLARLTRAIDAGDAAARLDRARILAALGLRSMARRDLDRVRGGADAALAARADALRAATVPAIATAAAPGPRTLEAALARTGEARSVADVSGQGAGLPAEGLLEDLAGRAEAPWLQLAAGEALLDRGDLARAWRAALDAGAAESELAEDLRARTRWTPIRRADAGDGLVSVPRTAGASEPTLAGKARAAMLGAPWDVDDALVLRGDGFEVLRASGSLSIELFCRDERGPGAPCHVDALVDGVARTVEIPDGAVRTLSAKGGGTHTIELVGPGAGAAVAVRTLRDGEVFVPDLSRTALRASPGHPLVATIAGGAPLRVEVLRGAARVEAGDRTLTLDAATRGVIPLVETGPVTVRVVGDADVLLARGELRERPPPPPPVATTPPEPALPREALGPLFDAAAPDSVERALPGHGASREVGVRGVHDALPDGTGWDAAEVEGQWLRTDGDTWTGATAWARGPHLALGAGFAAARTWDGGWLRGDLGGGAGHAVLPWDEAPEGSVTAGHVRGAITARHDLALGADVAVRLDGQLQGGWQSGPPDARVDPRAWNRWGLDHPVALELGTSLVARPWRDLSAQVGVDATSNTGPSLDRARVFGKARLLLGDLVVVGVDAALARRFTDLYRLREDWDPRVALSSDLGLWTTGDRRISVGAAVALSDDGLEGELGLTVLWSDGRGLHDLPPGAEAFRSARDPF